MITALGGVLSTACYENLTIVGLDRTEANRDIELDIKELAALFVDINKVVMNGALVKLEVMNAVCCLTHTRRVAAKAT